jgi:glyoxylase-like metal-dependent hydrolase (beta-lactamase superfamily II)
MTITWTHFPVNEAGFFRAPVLLTGPREALLIDGGFTLDDGRAVARAIAATGKRLTTVYVSQSDPDYYFSLGPIRAAFPEARVIAAPAAVAAIEASVQKKLDIWGPRLGANGPQTRADVVIPTPSDEPTLVVDGEVVEIVDAQGLANRRSLWVPSLRAVVGGVMVFAGVHVWTADSPTLAQRAAWRTNLDILAGRAPAIVVPGHAAPGAATDASAIAYTRAYLAAFDEEVTRAAGSAAVIEAMKARYPGAGMGVALEIGAKVATGEMTWG